MEGFEGNYKFEEEMVDKIKISRYVEPAHILYIDTDSEEHDHSKCGVLNYQSDIIPDDEDNSKDMCRFQAHVLFKIVYKDNCHDLGLSINWVVT